LEIVDLKPGMTEGVHDVSKGLDETRYTVGKEPGDKHQPIGLGQVWRGSRDTVRGLSRQPYQHLVAGTGRR
jgi:hypothetical protein